MSAKSWWHRIGLSLIAAGPLGGFLLGLIRGGDPDPNPIGRVVYACMMAVRTPWHAGFPPDDLAGGGRTLNAWPWIVVAALLILGLLAYPDRKRAKRS